MLINGIDTESSCFVPDKLMAFATAGEHSGQFVKGMLNRQRAQALIKGPPVQLAPPRPLPKKIPQIAWIGSDGRMKFCQNSRLE
ncbi:MAG: hypothetical protein ACLQVY_01150 [Limisphaerales bacterium]